ncbi:MAG: hypothetical protein ACI837_000981 [Crocinitomicaceae bacterium]|jgi:hypothetical protein
MHLIEPYYRWRSLYIASEDDASPFFGREYSEFEFQDHIYNYYIHPQWDPIGSPTLYVKIIYVDYDTGYAVIELLGEWNDAIENDVMTLKRDLIDEMLPLGIDKYMLIGENVLNFHSSDDCYYEEWFEDVEDGWIAFINFHDHVKEEIQQVGIDHYVVMGGEMEELEWRSYLPNQLFDKVNGIITKRLE